MKRAWVVVLVLMMAATTAWAQDAVLLKYKFTPGETHTYAMTGKGAGTIVAQGLPEGAQEIRVAITMDGSMTMTTESVDEAGNGTVLMFIGPMRMTVATNGQSIQMTMDLTNGTMTLNGQEIQIPMPPEVRDLLTGGIRATMSPYGQTLSVAGLEKLTGLMQMAGLSNVSIEELMRQSGPQMPTVPVSEGAEWKHEAKISLPGSVTPQKGLTMSVDYKLLSLHEPEGSCIANIQMSGDYVLPGGSTFTMPIPDGGQVDVTISTMHQRVAGNTLFDYARGVMTGSTIATTLDIDMRTDVKPSAESQAPPMSMTTVMRDFTMTIGMTLQ